MLNNREIKNIIGTIHILDSYMEGLLDAHNLDVAKGNSDGADYVNNKIRMFNELLDTAEVLGLEFDGTYEKLDLVYEDTREDELLSKIILAIDEYRGNTRPINPFGALEHEGAFNGEVKVGKNPFL
ncbi:hypothetical protein [Romboutsia ilealis]|uniref:hypothetical protein n=1 Tax=Romboutsia ilealis TaxID=1115758 RepID=UPI0025739D4C|nr:hypothetical protein [Romboutsia ilealis]